MGSSPISSNICLSRSKKRVRNNPGLICELEIFSGKLKKGNACQDTDNIQYCPSFPKGGENDTLLENESIHSVFRILTRALGNSNDNM